MKSVVIQKTRTTSKGVKNEVDFCSYINQRVCSRPIAIFNAWACSERCRSSFGDRT